MNPWSDNGSCLGQVLGIGGHRPTWRGYYDVAVREGLIIVLVELYSDDE